MITHRTRTEIVTEWLYSHLQGGTPQPVGILLQHAHTHSYSTSLVYKAASRLGVISERNGYPARAHWHLERPEPPIVGAVICNVPWEPRSVLDEDYI